MLHYRQDGAARLDRGASGRYFEGPRAEAPLESLGLVMAPDATDVVARAGESVVISDLVAPRRVATRSLARYKSWVGTPDEYVDPATYPLGARQMPRGPWSDRPVSGLGDLTPEEAAEIEKAGYLYLFGYSPWVESYRGVLETCRAPFHAAVYHVGHLRLESRARLVVDGEPSVLVVDELVIEPAASLVTHTVCRAFLGRVERLS